MSVAQIARGGRKFRCQIGPARPWGGRKIIRNQPKINARVVLLTCWAIFYTDMVFTAASAVVFFMARMPAEAAAAVLLAAACRAASWAAWRMLITLIRKQGD